MMPISGSPDPTFSCPIFIKTFQILLHTSLVQCKKFSFLFYHLAIHTDYMHRYVQTSFQKTLFFFASGDLKICTLYENSILKFSTNTIHPLPLTVDNESKT